MALLGVRNHQMITYNKVLGNRARLTHHPSTYKIPWLNLLKLIRRLLSINFLTKIINLQILTKLIVKHEYLKKPSKIIYLNPIHLFDLLQHSFSFSYPECG